MAERKYIIELRNSDDDLVDILENAYDIAYTELINSAHVLDFKLPMADSKVDDIILANYIWLRDYENDTVIRKFRLNRKFDSRGDTNYVEIEAFDLLSQLGKEIAVDYLAEDATVTTIVNALLAMQVLTPAITLGTISSSYASLTRSIEVDGDSILRALLRLRETVGGYIYIDNSWQLQWTDSIGEDKGQQIRYRKNLIGIDRDIDYSKLINRLYAYGAGEGEQARIKLSDAEGQTEDYVEDTASQSTWGGIYPGVVVDRSITHPDTLLAWANLKLAELKNPTITYSVDMVDLSQSTESDFSFDELQIGSVVNVIDEDLGLEVSVTVVKIQHSDLLNPQDMQIELENRVKDITDVLSGVYDIQQLEQHLATKIGAGQVIVLGDFTVIDWVTGGTTNIKGDYIRTGIISSNDWPTNGMWIDLTNGLVKIGGSSSPVLEWDGTTLKIQGNLEISGYIEVGGAADDVNSHSTTISGGKITTGSITADKLNVTDLSAISANIGTITSGSISGVIITAGGGAVILDSGGIEIHGQVFDIYDVSNLLGSLWGLNNEVVLAVSHAGANIVIYASSATGGLSIGGGVVPASPGDGELILDAGTLIKFGQNIEPDTDGALNIGSASKQINKLYVKELYVSSILQVPSL